MKKIKDKLGLNIAYMSLVGICIILERIDILIGMVMIGLVIYFREDLRKFVGIKEKN